jgi:hypothetical protein
MANAERKTRTARNLTIVTVVLGSSQEIQLKIDDGMVFNNCII